MVTLLMIMTVLPQTEELMLSIYSSDAEIFICSCLYRILNATNISIISLLLVILDQRQFCGGLSSNLALTIYNAINE